MQDVQDVAEEEEDDARTAQHDQEALVLIPLIPHAASELRMAALLSEIQQLSNVQQPFWQCSKRLGLIAEINQLRGLPGPHAASMDVRLRNIEVESSCYPKQWAQFSAWTSHHAPSLNCTTLGPRRRDSHFPGFFPFFRGVLGNLRISGVTKPQSSSYSWSN